MTRTRFGALAALTLSLVLAACSTPDLTAKPSSPSTALVTDADLDAASLEIATTDVALSAIDEGTAPEGAEIDLSGESQLSSQAVIPGASGYVNYLRVDKSSGTSITQLWLANQATDQSTLIYEGTRSINSTTVNLAGNTVFFTAAVTTGSSNFDVYKLTLSNNAVSRLTTTTTAENDISVSANGQIVVWGGINPSGGKRAVFVRTYSGTSFTQKVLGVSNGNLYEPTVSGDGAWIAMIRQTTSTQVVRYQRSSNSYLTVVTPSTSVYVRAPSVSNGGGKVAWGENPKQSGNSTVKVKTISGGSTATVASVAGLIQQPQLTSDSAYITYAAFYNGALNVFTKKLSGGQTVRITSDTSPNLSTGMFWQKDATVTVPGATISGAVSGSEGYPIRVKLFQVATGALYREVAVSNGRYSFTNVPAARYYVTAYSDSSYDAVQNFGERAGAFGRPAIPQQLNAVSGSYTANIAITNPYEIEDNGSIDTDNLLLLGTTVNGYTSVGSEYEGEVYDIDYDFYKLLVPAAGTYSLETSGACRGEDGSSFTDTVLELYNASGSLLEEDDDGAGDDTCSLISYNFTQSGTYFIAVRPFQDRGGDYNLIFQR